MQEISAPVAGRGVSREGGHSVLDGVDWKGRLSDVLERVAGST